MSTWSATELQILENFLHDNVRAIRQADYVQLANALRDTLGKVRSTASIKKKLCEVRRVQRQIENDEENGPVRQRAQAWTQEKTARPVQRLQEANGASKAKKVNNIVGDFPGRTAKAIVIKLRKDFSDIYYGRGGHQKPGQQEPIAAQREAPPQREVAKEHVDRQVNNIEIPREMIKKFHAIFRGARVNNTRIRVRGLTTDTGNLSRKPISCCTKK